MVDVVLLICDTCRLVRAYRRFGRTDLFLSTHVSSGGWTKSPPTDGTHSYQWPLKDKHILWLGTSCRSKSWDGKSSEETVEMPLFLAVGTLKHKICLLEARCAEKLSMPDGRVPSSPQARRNCAPELNWTMQKF